MKTAKKPDIDKSADTYVPNKKEWEQMSAYERSKKVECIISALEQESSLMGETTIHFNARATATETLKRYYKGSGKKVFIASDLHTLYPGEYAFYPDLLVVFDVEDHHRSCWNVHKEKKGLDFALEIISKSSRRKDQVEKLNLFARLGIPEYFIYDPDKYKLSGYQLVQNNYQPIIPDFSGRIFSSLLGLSLSIDNYKLRFVSIDGLEILFGDELIHRLNDKLSDKDEAITETLIQLDEAEKQKEEERQLKEEAELKIKQLEKELKKLKGK